MSHHYWTKSCGSKEPHAAHIWVGAPGITSHGVETSSPKSMACGGYTPPKEEKE